MIIKDCKRLIEVDFPIALVSVYSAKEKEARAGHIPKIHIWPAARPTGACRSVLIGLLLPDPIDPNCSPKFKVEAKRILTGIDGIGPRTDMDLQKELLKFIADFACWDNSSDKVYLKRARSLVKSAYPDETPLVIDPFAGGGSIPLEALRVGCETFASDLNPVACMILKVILDDIPRYGSKLADELQKTGAEIKIQTEKELAKYYPPDPDGAQPITYLWARTVRCEAPNCGAEIPLAKSFWLCKKGNKKTALRHKIMRPKDESPQVEFEIFEPKSEKDVPGGTVARAKATCLVCGSILPPERVRAQLSTRRGGADVIFDNKGHRKGGARLQAVVTLKPGERGRYYRLPVDEDYEVVRKAMWALEKIATEKLPGGLSMVPDESTPVGGGSGAGRAFSIQKYGMLQWGDLFTARQKISLITFVSKFKLISMSDPCKDLMALCFDKMVDMNTNLCVWQAHALIPAHMMSRYAIPMNWDFAETNPIAESSGSIIVGIKRTLEGLPRIDNYSSFGTVEIADATESPLPNDSGLIWFTDPPYYDAVPYADLSDFFYVWLKRTLPGHPLLKDPYDSFNPLTHKTREAVQDETKQFEGRPKDRIFFEEQMAKSFAEGRRVLKEDGIGCVVFAHKTTEGWEALLSGLVKAGWVVTASWPITTEMGSRLRARESAALASSVHLILRPRTADAPIGGWENILQELPKRISIWVDRLSNEGIRGADLVFSCIGPAMELFSRHPKVETADGREVKLDEFLAKVWEVLGRIALQRVLGGGAKAGEPTGALEEDARLTALFLWTLQSTANGNGKAKVAAKAGKRLPGGEEGGEGAGDEERDEREETGDEEGKAAPKVKGGFSLPYDIARRFAQPLGIHLEDWEGRVIETDKGVIRLLPVSERAARLFGKEGAEAVAKAIEERKEKTVQMTLFPEERKGAAPELMKKGAVEESEEGGGAKAKTRGRKGKAPSVTREATTLDRLHAAMLLQRAGQSAALKVLLEEERARGPDFERLANALSALYPVKSEEKRLLDAMLLAMPRS